MKNKQSIAQKRNWVKRLITCYTAGYQTVLSQYNNSLTSCELAHIEALVTTGKLLLEHWPPRKEDKKS